MGNVYLTADLHFFHANVIKYCDRPYGSVEEMNQALIDNWNSVVTDDDTVYVLGDFSLAFRPVEIFTQRLNGLKYLIAGNHDFCHSYNKKSRNGRQDEWIKKYNDNGFTVLPEFYTTDLEGIGPVNMCHIPYDCEDPRYKNYKMADDGKILLCGHVHEKFLIKETSKGTVQINVGVDAPCSPWYMRPAKLEEIKDVINRAKKV